MSDYYIKREDAIRSIADNDEFKGERWIKEAWADYLIEDAKPADVVPIMRAHWIQEEYWSEGVGMGEDHGHYYKCSACGKRVKLHDLYLDEYCRKRGAEMYEAKECERKRQEFDEKLAARNKEWRCY